MTPPKSHVSELKKWMPMHSKKKQKTKKKEARPKQKIHKHPVSPMGVFLTCSKSAKYKFFDLFKVSKNTQKQPSQEQSSKEQKNMGFVIFSSVYVVCLNAGSGQLSARARIIAFLDKL